MTDFYSLDIETAPIVEGDGVFALEPYTCGERSEITSVAVWGPRGLVAQLNHRQNGYLERFRDILSCLEGKTVYAHRATFDVPYLIKQFGNEIVSKIIWKDTVILNKFCINGQKAEKKRISYSLINCVKRAIKSDPDLEEFLDIKKQEVTAGVDFDYWLRRGRLDAKFTYLLVERLIPYLGESVIGFDIVCKTIYPISEGYVRGILVDVDALDHYESELVAEQKVLLKRLNLAGTVISSPTQLAKLLFEEMLLTPIGFTPKGKPSTSSENLMRLHQKNPDNVKLQDIMDYKKTATMMSKYVKGFRKSLDYLGTNVIHGTPSILATITGRMTYSTKIRKKYQTSIALHQLPRKDKGIKRCLVAPEGYKIFYFDFSAQEGRVMAQVAGEKTMIKEYNDGIDLHSSLTENIFGTPYKTIVEANLKGEPKDIVEQRQAGKLTGLSSFYRIGAKSLAGKFFTTYEYDITVGTANSYLSSFKKAYPGVVEYWKDAIFKAKQLKTATAFGGWKFRIHEFDWKGESSAINHPIQGGGSMLTYTAIGEVKRVFPEAILLAQVHDSLTYIVPVNNYKSACTKMIKYLNEFDYGKILGFDQVLPFIVDGAVGDNFSDLESI